MNDANKNRMDHITEWMYLGALGLYLFYVAQSTTTFSFGIEPECWKKIFYVVSICVSVRVLTYFILYKCALKEKLFPILLFIGMAICTVLSFRVTEYYPLLFILVLAAGGIGIRYEKIIRCFIFSVGICYLSAILCVWCGSITNLIYIRKGTIRSSWGIIYPTDFASYAVYLAIAVWIAWKKLPIVFNILIGCVSLFFAYEVADSMTSIICSLLLLTCCLFELVFNTSMKQQGFLRRTFFKVVDFVCIALFPVLSVIMFFFIYAYKKGYSIAEIVNINMHNRLKLAFDAIQEHGIHLLGKAFEQVGNGGSSVLPENYNFVDSSYPLIILRCGILLFLLITIIWSYIAYHSIKSGNRRLALGMAIVAVHSFSEHHFIEVNYNIFLILFLTNFTCEQPITKCRNVYSLRQNITLLITATFTLVAGYLCIPKMLMIYRTIVTALSISESQRGRIWMAIIAAIAVCFLGFALWFANKIIFLCLNRQQIRKAYFVVPLSAIFVILISFWVCKPIVQKEFEINTNVMEEESDIIESIISEGNGRVYVVEDPEVYQKRFGNINSSVFNGEELARYHNTTVIMKAHYDSNCFFSKGFLYTQISDEHAIYTNNSEIERMLKKKGYVLTGYYPVEDKVDLLKQSKFNSLPMTKDGALELFGPDQTMGMGPYLNLRAGTYTATYNLELLKKNKVDEINANDCICIIRVTTNIGQNVVIEKNLYRKDFDDSGRCVAEMTFKIPDSRYVEFLVYAQTMETLLVNEVTYQKTPVYDIHSTYDTDGRVVWEEYYDMEGNPYAVSGGYNAISYSYDKKGNCVSQTYYYMDDETDKWNIIYNTAGYAGILKEYDDYNRVIKECYLGLDGEPIALRQGQAGVCYTYDENGNQKEITYLNKEGSPAITIDGYVSISKTYNDLHKVINEAYFDMEGESVSLPTGQYGVGYGYDENGNQTEIKYLDRQGGTIPISAGYAVIKKAYDDRGRNTAEYYYDENGNLFTRKEGYAYTEKEYDEAGNVIVQKFFDQDNHLVMTTSGYAEIRKTYNEKNRVTKEIYFDTEGNPIALSSGQFEQDYVYDNKENQIEVIYMDAAGLEMMIASGYSRICREYNEKRQNIREYYCDTIGNIVESSNKYGQLVRTYDENGNIITQQCMDAEGKPTMNTSGYSRVLGEYNDKHEKIWEEYYDSEGNHCASSGGYTAISFTYDEKGNCVSQIYYYMDNKTDEWKTVYNTNGYAGILKEYDNYNRVINEWYLGLEEKPIVLRQGQAGVCYIYDENGNQTEMKYLDRQGKTISISDGYAVIKKAYDDRGRNTTEYYYDENGSLFTRKEGYAYTEKEYDEAGNVIVQKFFDQDNHLVMTTSGYAEIRKTYNEKNRVTKEIYFDTEGNSIAVASGQYGMQYHYDDFGNVIGQYYLGENDEYIVNTSGFAILKKIWNCKRELIKEMYYDENNNQIGLSSGQYEQNYVYDDKRNQIEVIYMDAMGQEMMIKSGYSRLCKEYNDKRQVICEYYCDLNGEIVNNIDGYAKIIRTYDENGNNITQAYMDAEGKPVMNTEGYYLIRRSFNDKNEKIWEAYYDIENNRINNM